MGTGAHAPASARLAISQCPEELPKHLLLILDLALQHPGDPHRFRRADQLVPCIGISQLVHTCTLGRDLATGQLPRAMPLDRRTGFGNPVPVQQDRPARPRRHEGDSE